MSQIKLNVCRQARCYVESWRGVCTMVGSDQNSKIVCKLGNKFSPDLQGTVLESITGWVRKSHTSSKLVFNHSYWLIGVFKIQILYLDLFLDLFWAIFGLRRPKTGQKIKIVHFLLFFVLKFFLNTIFWILFSWMETIYFLGFFSLKKCFIKKYFPIFFSKIFLWSPLWMFFLPLGDQG